MAAYEAALNHAKAPRACIAIEGTVSWLIEQYLGSLRFQNLSTDIKRRVPDIFRVVLDPAICRKMLLELLLGDARWFALWREQDRS